MENVRDENNLDKGKDGRLLANQFDYESSSTPIKDLDVELLIKTTFTTSINNGIELLFKYYYRALCSHAVRYVSSKEIAEDIVSDIFCKFHTDQIYLKVETSFRAYLYTAVRNRAFDYVRTENSRSFSNHETELLTIRPDQEPDQLTQFEDLYHDVEMAVNTLPPKRRKIYIMHRFEGRKYGEIADELNLSLRTVEAQMYMATSQVRKIIQQKWFY